MDHIGSNRIAQSRGSFTVACLVIMAFLTVFSGCNGTPGTERNDLSAMETVRIVIKGHQFEVWLASSTAERTLGLMQVTEEELAPFSEATGQSPPVIHRGMLFIFPSEQPLGFWMRNTITPLDIAYIRRDGTIVNTYTMAPLETRIYPSIEPAILALEVKAGTFAQLDIRTQDRAEIPESVLKTKP
ncbi:MAG: DUF192 domain-containing protein [Planctomycetota bacterium]